MNDSKLINSLKTLSAKEFRDFLKFTASPYFNTNRQVSSLAENLFSFYPEYALEEADAQKIFASVFPGEKFSQQKLSDVMTYLMRVFDQFLAQRAFEKPGIEATLNELSQLRTRGIELRFNQQLKKSRQEIERYPLRDQQYYYYNYLLEGEADEYFIKKEIRGADNSMQRKADNLDKFYLSVKLRNSCEMINRKNIISMNYDLKMLEEILHHLKNNFSKYESEPAIVIYYNILMTLTDSEAQLHFFELKLALKKYYQFFEQAEARQMYNYAVNYCIKKINKGETVFLSELLSLYKELLQTRLIFDNDQLSQWDYKNIVSAAMRAEEFEWTKNFIEKYKSAIPLSVRKNAYIYNMASYYYSTHEYKKALKLLQEVEFTDLFYHLGAKSMLMKMYFEMNEMESFFSLIDTFIVYLKRNKLISEYQREVHLNLVKFTQKAFKLRMKYSGIRNAAFYRELNKIKLGIEQTKNITNLQWLKGVISALTPT